MDLPSPSSDAEPPVAWALADLRRAVEVALAREGLLLTAGELCVARAFLALPEDAAALYARLHMRRGRVFRLEGLAYAEVPDVAGAAAGLVAAGFAWRGAAVLSVRALAEAHTVAELKAACRALGLPVGGRRDTLLARLDRPDARPLLAAPSLVLRHDGLFLRLARLFLGRGHADLSRLVVERLALVRFPAYTPTGGPGLFPRRAELRAWEDGWLQDALLWQLGETKRGEALVARLDDDLAVVEAAPPPPPWRARLSARRLAAGRIRAAGRHLERTGQPARAVGIYQRLLAAGVQRPGPVVHRLALALDACGRPGHAAARCQEALAEATAGLSEEDRVALERTGRRLARKARVGWAPLPPRQSPRSRRLRLPQAAVSDGRRPAWQSPAGPLPLEPAVIATLADAGRTAVHAEGGLWRTLFGLLFADVLFLPVPGMLPTPMRSGPLDLGRPGFVERRAEAVAEVLAAVRAGEGPARLQAAWDAREGEAIAGVSWSHDPALLQRTLDELGGGASAAILERIAHDWRGAARGLPDLVVLAGPAVRLADAFPARLAEPALLVELKGPGDQLRDGQVAWLDHLLRAGVPAELWSVEPAAAGPSRAGRQG